MLHHGVDVLGVYEDPLHGHRGRGSARADPATNVCRPDGSFHDLGNLYGTGASLFPTSSGFNRFQPDPHESPASPRTLQHRCCFPVPRSARSPGLRTIGKCKLPLGYAIIDSLLLTMTSIC
jgi:hypothetical protein